MIWMPSLKQPLTFAYRFEIKQKNYGHLGENSYPFLPILIREFRFGKFDLKECVFELRSFSTNFKPILWFSTGCILHLFDLKLSVVLIPVLTSREKISEKKEKFRFLLVLQDKTEPPLCWISIVLGVLPSFFLSSYCAGIHLSKSMQKPLLTCLVIFVKTAQKSVHNSIWKFAWTKID
jgi:hypothetical protein